MALRAFFAHLTSLRVTSQVRSSEHTPLLTALLEGPAGAGKTALAATLGLESQFPFVKVVSSDAMVGFSEPAKAAQIAKVFEDAYRVRAHVAFRSCDVGFKAWVLGFGAFWALLD